MSIQYDVPAQQFAFSLVDTDIEILSWFGLAGRRVDGHELSHQNGWRGNGPRCCIAPPQSGQISSAWPVSR
jgi:hypothetical protein